MHWPCPTGRYFFQRAKPWMANQTKAQEISMGWWRVPVMSKSRSISMLLESCPPLIFPLHFTFIHFKSTDMCLPVDWLSAIFSCSGLVPLQCLGCVNGKIKPFHMQIWTPRTPAFFLVLYIALSHHISDNSQQFTMYVTNWGISYCSGILLSGWCGSLFWEDFVRGEQLWMETGAVHQLSDTVVVYDW